MSRILNEQDVKNILYGATLMGTGGGGSLSAGLHLISEAAKKGEIAVKLLDANEMGSDEYAVTVAGLGAPSAIDKVGYDVEAVHAYNAYKKVAAQEGKDLKYLMSVELGGFNTAVPIYLSALEGIPVVDADGAGRAVPELGTLLYAVYGITPSPMVLAGKNGDVLIAYLADPQNTSQAEVIARNMCMSYQMIIGLSTYIVNKEDILNKLATGTISQCMKIGEAISKAKKENTDVISEIGKVIFSKELFRGKIEKIETRAAGGFDFGVTTLKGVGEFSGKTWTIDFKNENHLLKNEKSEVVVTVPDMICLMDMDELVPLTNADTKEGMTLSVIGIPAPAIWTQKKEGFDCWVDILKLMGYTGGYVKIK